MPRFDGTGPVGRGPMTGWGRGYCLVPSRRWSRGPNHDARQNYGRRNYQATAAERPNSLRREIAELRTEIESLRQLAK